MMTSTTAPDGLLAEIRELVDAPVRGAGAPKLDRIETTLTDGYAAALQLEAERMRLEKRIGELAATSGDGDVDPHELSLLASRLADADGSLTRLRELLRTLRA